MQEAKRGDRVSLNTSQRLFYFQEGDGGIMLNAEGTDMAVIPQNATDHHLAQINHAIRANQLIIGWPEKSIETKDRDSEMRELLDGGRNKIDEWIHDMKSDKKIKQETKIAQLEKLVSMEKSGKNRKSVIRVAESVLGTMAGVSPVEESEHEKLEIKLTSGNEEAPEAT